VKASGFTPRQRRIILLLVLVVVVVFALLAGFSITFFQGLETAPIATPLTLPRATSPPSPTAAPSRATPTPEGGIWPQVQAARLFDQIAHQVETERALSPRAEVPLSFLSEDEMAETLRELYTKNDPPTLLPPLTALGLLPDEAMEVQAQRPAGLYVTDHRQLYVSTDRSQDDPQAQALLAHAYVHALQDQHFDLEATHARAQTTDERLAARALVEGDATLVTALYTSQDLSSVDWGTLTELIMEAEQPDYSGVWAGHDAWGRLQRFPNQEGRVFARAVVDQGGWEALNRCYTDLPRSTEAILHPARYLGLASAEGETASPVSVAVPDLDPVLGDRWSPLLQDTLGEFVVGLFMNQVVPEERAWQIADGWDGDTFVVWQREDGRRMLVWRTIWSDSSEAADYEQALRLLVPQLHVPVQPIDPPLGLPGLWWETSDGTVNLRRTARYVMLVRAPDTNTAINVLRELP
jgi:hypothetical protein